MRNKLKQSARLSLLASLVATTLTACGEKPVPVTDLRPWKPIVWKCGETDGDTRRQIIAHNSVYATQKTGKPVVYADKCEKAPAPAKTS